MAKEKEPKEKINRHKRMAMGEKIELKKGGHVKKNTKKK